MTQAKVLHFLSVLEPFSFVIGIVVVCFSGAATTLTGIKRSFSANIGSGLFLGASITKTPSGVKVEVI